MTDTKKYEILKNVSIVHKGKTLYRIKALRAFTASNGSTVEVGDIGGYIESENNLSQKGSCWIYDDAKVYDDAFVHGDAKVYGNAQIFDKAEISDHSQIYDDAIVSNAAWVFGNARIYENAEVYGDAYIGGKVQIYGEAEICDKAKVFDKVLIFDNAKIFGGAQVFGKAKICGDAQVFGKAKICGDAQIYGKAEICDLEINTGEYMYDAVDMTALLLKVQVMHKQVLRMSTGKYLIDENYLNNIIQEFTKFDKARKVKEELNLVALPLKSKETCVLLEKISDALKKIENMPNTLLL